MTEYSVDPSMIDQCARVHDVYQQHEAVVRRALDYMEQRYFALAEHARTGRNFTNDEERERTVAHFRSIATDARTASIALSRAMAGEDEPE